MADIGIRSMAKKIPGVRQLLASTQWKLHRHRVALRSERRVNSHFTGFNRLPTQFEALAGPVSDHLDRSNGSVIKVIVVGCSNGAEAYTISKVLRDSPAKLKFEIVGVDIEDEILKTARGGRYDATTEVHNNKRLPDSFVADLFDKDGEHYCIKPEYKEGVSFQNTDVLDLVAMQSLGVADIVFAQNFLFHLSPAQSKVALDNIAGLLAPRGVVFIDGTDLTIRERATRKHNLDPLLFEIEKIHNEAIWTRGVGWPYQYWGLEPYGTVRRDTDRRYSTIFLRA